MLPYFLLMFISAITPMVIYRARKARTADISRYIVEKRNKMTLRIFFTGFFVLLALRDITVGIDLVEYLEIFEECSFATFRELQNLNWEIGYTVYNKLLSLLSPKYRWVLVFSAFLCLLPIYLLYAREKRYSYLLMVLFMNMPCFLMIFSGLRQAIAISIGILAYLALEKRKYILSGLMIALAASFHISACILVLLYPLHFVKIKTKYLLVVIPAMVALYIFRKPLLLTLIGLMPAKYVEFYGELKQTGAIGMMLLFLIFTTFAFVILDEEEMSQKDYFFRNALLIATVFQFFVPIHGLIQRASYYFMIFVPVSIAGIVTAPKKRLKNVSDLAGVVIGSFFTLYFFYTAAFSTDNLLGVFPYKFYWSN